MRRAQRQVEKKRAVGVGLGRDEGDGFSRESREHRDGIAVVDHAVVFNHGLHVAGVMKAVKAVESVGQRPIGNGAADRRQAVVFAGEGGACARIHILKVEMPLADDAGGVAMLSEKRGQGGSVFRDQAGSKALHHALLQFGSPGIAAGQQAVAGGRADG